MVKKLLSTDVSKETEKTLLNMPLILFRYKYFAALLAGCFFLSACENDINEVNQLGHPKTGVEVAKEVNIKYSVNGKRKALLTSPLMYRVQDSVSFLEFPNTVHVDFYDARDSFESKLDAHYAKYKDNQSKLFLKDSVRVVNINGDTLFCNELYWDKNRFNQEFYTDKPIRIRTRTHIIDGIGLDARQDFKEWHIVQPVGVLKVPATEFPN